MNKYMKEWLDQIGVSYGEKISCLVKAKVFTCDYIVKKAIESKDAIIMYHTALRLEGITAENIEKLAEAIIKENNLDAMFMFARYIKGAPVEKLVDEIIKSKNAPYIVKLASVLEDPPIEKLEKAIIKTGEAEYIYYYATNVINKDSGYNYNMVERLADAIIQTKNVKYIYEFAKNIFGAPMEKLAKAIIESKNEEYIEKFRELPNVPACFDSLVERAKLEKATEEEKMRKLLDHIYYNETDLIEFNADIYRRLFVDTEEELLALEEELKPKTKVLKPQNCQGMSSPPQFPGIAKK